MSEMLSYLYSIFVPYIKPVKVECILTLIAVSKHIKVTTYKSIIANYMLYKV